MQATLERLRQRREQGDEGGFTLIELLIVIVILGVLAAIVVFAVQSLTGSSASAACGSDLKTVQTATEAYKAQVGHYPQAGDSTGTDTPALVDTDNGVKAELVPQVTGGVTVGPWLRSDPSNAGHYQITVSSDGNGKVQVLPNGDTNPADAVDNCSTVK